MDRLTALFDGGLALIVRLVQYFGGAGCARWLWVLLAFFAHTVSAQESATESALAIQQEIDRTLWQPFKCAFEAMDGAALNALYARRVLRVTPDGIDTKSAFKAFNETRFEQTKREGGRVALDFWLDSRLTDAKTSYAVGFFRSGVIDESGNRNDYYGQFHIVLRKQRGGWKIVQDWDTDRIGGRKIGAKDFARGVPMVARCR